jgi:hypothetical protein
VAAGIAAARNSSFGELGDDTRSGFYASWIDGVTAPVPEAATAWMLLAGQGITLVSDRRCQVCRDPLATLAQA